MPIKIKLSEVNSEKVKKALSQSKEICLQCSLEKKHCEDCYIHLAVLALQSFLKEKDFDMAIDWKVLNNQHSFDEQKMLLLLETLEDICLHCGVLHIDECFVNTAIQVVNCFSSVRLSPANTTSKPKRPIS